MSFISLNDTNYDITYVMLKRAQYMKKTMKT